jgi:hypothetical protein
VIVALVAVGYVARELRAPMPPPARRAAPPAPPAAATVPPAPEAPPAGGYGIVASRNLFSPNRSEAPPAPVTATAPAVPKPNLYGILLNGTAPVAYLEDPTTKRVAGYRLGDAIAGGTVKQIGADHVVLNRPEGEVSVRLRDPSKPRPPAPTVAQPGIGPRAPGGVATAPGTPGGPQVPGAVMPQQPAGATILPRRPLPPNLLRRPPPPATDAQPQN